MSTVINRFNLTLLLSPLSSSALMTLDKLTFTCEKWPLFLSFLSSPMLLSLSLLCLSLTHTTIITTGFVDSLSLSLSLSTLLHQLIYCVHDCECVLPQLNQHTHTDNKRKLSFSLFTCILFLLPFSSSLSLDYATFNWLASLASFPCPFTFTTTKWSVLIWNTNVAFHRKQLTQLHLTLLHCIHSLCKRFYIRFITSLSVPARVKSCVSSFQPDRCMRETFSHHRYHLSLSLFFFLSGTQQCGHILPPLLLLVSVSCIFYPSKRLMCTFKLLNGIHFERASRFAGYSLASFFACFLFHVIITGTRMLFFLLTHSLTSSLARSLLTSEMSLLLVSLAFAVILC